MPHLEVSSAAYLVGGVGESARDGLPFPGQHAQSSQTDLGGIGAIVTGVVSPIPHPAESDPAGPDPAVRAPEVDPVAIRGCLTLDVVAVFDAEWEFVLEAAKQSKDLAGVGELLAKWRAFAYQELREPGAYFRVLATAAEVQRTGRAPAGSVSGAQIRARIEARLAEAGLPGTGRG